MDHLDIDPLYDALNENTLSGKRREFFLSLPADLRYFLQHQNGGQLPPHALNFLTGIPFAPADALLPSRPDFVVTFLGLGPEGTEDWNDLFHFNTVEDPEIFPEGMILVARGHYGDLAISLADEDKGAVYYQWRHFPSVAEHYREKRARVAESVGGEDTAAADWADAMALLERLAGSWTEFLGSFLEEETMDMSPAGDLELMVYDKMYEQIMRRVAYHNVALMLGPEPGEEGLRLLKNISAGFLPVYWEEELQAEAPGSGELYCTGQAHRDSWVLDRMLDALMLTGGQDQRRIAITAHFGKAAGYPLLEIRRSISDYEDRRRRKARQQAPALDEMLQNSREQALRTIQNLYLIGITGGEVTPEQDRFFAGIAREGGLDPEELMFIVRHRDGLGLMPPIFPAWAGEMREKVLEFLQLNGEPQPASREMADMLLRLLDEAEGKD